MNRAHEELCSSDEWAAYLAADVLPRVIVGTDLGGHMLETGPGFGRATDVLRTKVDRVTALEIEPAYADRLAERFAGTNVDIVVGDATDMRFPDDSFSAAGSFTMLHHVPTRASQDLVFAETARVLRPGGVFVGSDSLDSAGFRAFHEGDTCNPVDPGDLGDRLAAAGFADWDVSVDQTDPGDAEDPGAVVFFVARTPTRLEGSPDMGALKA